MTLTIRERYIPRKQPPCTRECSDRSVGCHSKCQRFIERKREDVKKRREIKECNRKIKDAEEYEILQRQKCIKARTRNWKGV